MSFKSKILWDAYLTQENEKPVEISFDWVKNDSFLVDRKSRQHQTSFHQISVIPINRILIR